MRFKYDFTKIHKWKIYNTLDEIILHTTVKTFTQIKLNHEMYYFI